ncbi:unnamed protein product, partial [Ectocarpus sp. 12 AP-2014]
ECTLLSVSILSPAQLWPPMSTKRKAAEGGIADGNGSKRKVRFRGKDDSEEEEGNGSRRGPNRRVAGGSSSRARGRD